MHYLTIPKQSTTHLNHIQLQDTDHYFLIFNWIYFFKKISSLLHILFILMTVYQLNACTGIIAAGTASTSIAMDRRNMGSTIEDGKISYKISQLIHKYSPKSHINIEVFNRDVLLTGEVSSVSEGQQAANLARNIANVRRVYNELAIGEPSKLSDRAKDTALTAKIKTYLIKDKLLQYSAFIVTTERSNVYLQGKVTQLEAQRATEIIRNIVGVRQVIKLFDYITEEEFKRPE